MRSVSGAVVEGKAFRLSEFLFVTGSVRWMDPYLINMKNHKRIQSAEYSSGQ